jgi:hypothetical protein
MGGHYHIICKSGGIDSTSYCREGGDKKHQTKEQRKSLKFFTNYDIRSEAVILNASNGKRQTNPEIVWMYPQGK